MRNSPIREAVSFGRIFLESHPMVVDVERMSVILPEKVKEMAVILPEKVKEVEH